MNLISHQVTAINPSIEIVQVISGPEDSNLHFIEDHYHLNCVSR